MRAPIRALSAVVFVTVAALAGAGALGVHNVVDDQEHRLLDGQAAAIGALLTASVQSIEATMTSVAAVDSAARGQKTLLAAAGRPLLEPAQHPAFLGVAVLHEGKVEAALGDPITDADLASAPMAGVVKDAAACTPQELARLKASACLVASPSFTVAGQRRIGFVLGAPTVPSGTLIVYETSIAEPEPAPKTAKPAPGAPFGGLDVQLFADAVGAPDQLIISTTGREALHGPTGRATFPVGTGKWLVLASSSTPLVGHFARITAWVLLAAGLLLALLMAAILEVLLRRRAYSERLVEERTAELSSSLEQLAEAQDQLVRAERLSAIGELASTIGHELRNPLGVITNALYLLRQRLQADGVSADERLARQLDTADREVAAAALIVSDLLEFARARDPIPTSVDVEELLSEVLSVAPPPRGVDVVRRGADADAAVAYADRDQLRQVLLNLVTNAYQAMPSGGELRLSAESHADRLRVTVTDTGEGMSEQTRQRLFEPFFTTKARGVGLGLVVTRRIIEAHGGTIDVRSEPGAGSSFLIDMPAYDRQPAGERA